MKIGKVNGRTVTRFIKDENGLIREISVPNSSDGLSDGGVKPILQLVNSGKPLIRQWISTIDKIYSKPRGTKKPTSEQFSLRKKLGDACWNLLIEKGLVDKSQHDYWLQRLHPYGCSPTNFETKSKQSLSGYWHDTFASDPIIAHTIAANIYSHLHESELRQSGRRKNTIRSAGLIENRAYSIEKSVFNPLALSKQTSRWTSEDLDNYLKHGDIAEDLLKALIKNHNIKYQKLPARKLTGAILSKHWAKVSGHGRYTEQTKEGGHSQERCKIFELHNTIRLHYAKLEKSVSGNQFPKSKYPTNMNALIKQIQNRHDNALVNHLVRIGRIIHYQGPKEDLETSEYWTSPKQAEIKETEAFVRVWRSSISQAARSIKAWVDPTGKYQNIANQVSDRDILQNANINNFIRDDDERRRALNVAHLFFGQYRLFEGLSDDDQKHVFDACLRFVASCRHNTFHFKHRTQLVSALKSELMSPLRYREDKNNPETLKTMNVIKNDWPQEAKSRVENLLSEDQKNLNYRLLKDLQGGKVDQFCSDDTFGLLFNAIQEAAQSDNSDVILPSFRRLLDRAGKLVEQANEPVNIGKGLKVANLPPKPKPDELKDEATNTRFIGLQALYSGPFRGYIEKLDANILQGYIDQVNTTTTELAKSANSRNPFPESIESRSTSLPIFGSNDTIISYFSRLIQATAQEFKVQKGYSSDATEAKAQAEFIEKFKRDFIGLAFEGFLEKKGFDWLLKVTPDGEPINKNPTPPVVTESVKSAEPWQAGLYLVLHFIPFDDVSRLLHQFKRWGALQSKHELASSDTKTAESEVNLFKETLSLFLQMHEGKIEGDGVQIGLAPFKALYETEATFNTVFLVSNEDATADRVAQTRKGLRHILRYNHMSALSFIYEKNKTTADDVAKLGALEMIGEDNLSDVGRAHKNRTILHKDAIDLTGKDKMNIHDVGQYRDALRTIEQHKALVGKVYLGDHVRLHRLMMMVLARLVDFAGLWERDCAENGFIANAKAYLQDTHNQTYDWKYPKADEAKQTRNDLDHFNILVKSDANAPDINLTEVINRTRTMMSYDRKLKNAVSKSIIEMMEREGILLSWKMTNHKLHSVSVKPKNIPHLKDKMPPKGGKKPEKGQGRPQKESIIEQRHNPAFLRMVAALFGGKVDKPKRKGEPGPKVSIARKAQPQSKQRSAGQNLTGQVKWFNTAKGFGFIAVDGCGDDVFVHISTIEASGLTGLSEDQSVGFVLKDGRGGKLEASKIVLL